MKMTGQHIKLMNISPLQFLQLRICSFHILYLNVYFRYIFYSILITVNDFKKRNSKRTHDNEGQKPNSAKEMGDYCFINEWLVYF